MATPHTQPKTRTDTRANTQAPTQPTTLAGLVPVAQRDVTLMLESGYLLMELQRHKEAEDVFHGVMALLPTSEVPHMALGNLLFSQGRFAQALKSHSRAVELNPASATAYASCAESLFFLKRADEALAQLKTCLKTPDDGPAHEFAKALQEAYDLGIFNG